MHIHVPRPLRGWREFLGEIGIIAIGVFIASAAEYLIQQWRWHELAKESNRAIALELESAALYDWERLAVQPCLQARIRELAQQLNRNEARWTASPMEGLGRDVNFVIPPVYLAPIRNYTSDAWKNALNSGSLYHLPAKRVAAYAGIYSGIAKLEAAQAEETVAETRLSPLSTDRVLDARARLDMLANLAEVDRSNALMVLVAKQNIQLVRRLRIDVPKSRIAADRAEILAADRNTHGACVTDLPLDLG